MDLIMGLPQGEETKNNAILTVVDRLTRRAHFWATKTIVTSEGLATLLLE